MSCSYCLLDLKAFLVAAVVLVVAVVVVMMVTWYHGFDHSGSAVVEVHYH